MQSSFSASLFDFRFFLTFLFLVAINICSRYQSEISRNTVLLYIKFLSIVLIRIENTSFEAKGAIGSDRWSVRVLIFV